MAKINLVHVLWPTDSQTRRKRKVIRSDFFREAEKMPETYQWGWEGPEVKPLEVALIWENEPFTLSAAVILYFQLSFTFAAIPGRSFASSSWTLIASPHPKSIPAPIPSPLPNSPTHKPVEFQGDFDNLIDNRMNVEYGLWHSVSLPPTFWLVILYYKECKAKRTTFPRLPCS